MKSKKRYYILAAILAFIVAINLLFFFVKPNEIVEYVGVENSYLIVFAVSAIGGLSTLTGLALFTTIVTFAAGGSEPWLLGLAGGLGIFISDSIFYFLAKYGRESVPESWDNTLKKVEKWIKKHPPWAVLTAMYLYLGFSPFPNDLLMIALVVGGYSYKKIALVLLAGSITVAMLTAYLGDAIPWL